MPILNRILGAVRGAANTGARPAPRRTTAPGHPGAGAPRSGRGLLSSLLGGRRRRPMI